MPSIRKANLNVTEHEVVNETSFQDLKDKLLFIMLYLFLVSSTPPSTVSDHDRIPVVTSLPPAVDGHLRCFLRVSVPTIHWTVHRYPADVQVRLKWWGEDGDGVLFRYSSPTVFKI